MTMSATLAPRGTWASLIEPKCADTAQPLSVALSFRWPVAVEIANYRVQSPPCAHRRNQRLAGVGTN